MSIINNPAAPVNTQAPTLEQKQTQCKLMLARTAQQNYTMLVRLQKEGIAKVWDNPNGLTPQEVCDAAGTDAAQLFTVHGLLTECLIAIATASGIAPDIALPTKAFTKNVDGTVTVSEAPYTV